jgi:transaldolase
MNETRLLRALGQSLWLDNITRKMLGDGSFRRYIEESSVTDLTSNPTIFDEAIDGARAFVKSWKELLERIADKRAALAAAKDSV